MGASPSKSRRVTDQGRRPAEVVRSFNRLYTRRLGLLGRRYLGSQLNLTEARVLYELAARRTSTARDIARDLGIDVAYLSRILAAFRERGWLTRGRSTRDRREQWLRLTPAGRAAFAPLDAAAAEQATAMLASVPARERPALVGAMRQISRVLEGEATAAVRLRDLRVGDIGWIIHRQAILYAEEFGWDMTYEALIAGILARFVSEFDARRDAAWIAEQNGAIVGSVFLVREGPKLGRLRLLYVEPSARGLGLGGRLVARCVDGARERGYRGLTLWTNDVLVAARRLYEAAGFRLVKQERHRSFGKTLTGQTWTLDLPPVRRPAHRD